MLYFYFSCFLFHPNISTPRFDVLRLLNRSTPPYSSGTAALARSLHQIKLHTGIFNLGSFCPIINIMRHWLLSRFFLFVVLFVIFFSNFISPHKYHEAAWRISWILPSSATYSALMNLLSPPQLYRQIWPLHYQQSNRFLLTMNEIILKTMTGTTLGLNTKRMSTHTLILIAVKRLSTISSLPWPTLQVIHSATRESFNRFGLVTATHFSLQSPPRERKRKRTKEWNCQTVSIMPTPSVYISAHTRLH